jgi:NAD(P)-dependent dehydrogenase (short-subunit alcohol dehydrogenase family)
MRAQRSGTIVNVSSVVTWAPLPFSGPYTASKAALSALSETLHYELAPFGVRVVLIEPGPYPTTRFLANMVDGLNSTATSPYADLRLSYQPAIARLIRGEPADAQEVADGIYDAVYTDTRRFRHVVGASAQGIARMRQSTDFEGFERFIRDTLDWHVGARQDDAPAVVGHR